MAITDGLICQIYPVAGETAIKNIVNGTLFTGTGTPTLVDEVAEKAWAVTAGTLLESAIPSKTPSSNVAGSGVTIAIRFKPTANGSGADFLSILGVKPDSASVDAGVRISRAGNGIFRGRSEYQMNTSLSGFVLNTIYTLVYKIELSPVAANDFGKLWRNMIGRVGADADASSGASEYSISRTLNRAFVNCHSGVAFTLLDFAYWDRELTDAESADVADNYRLVMPAPSGGTAPTGTVTIGTITPNSTGASVPFTYSASDQTGFEYRINGGTAVTGTTSPQVVTGLSPSTAYTIEIRAINASGAGAWSTPANFTTSAATTPITFSGTIPNQSFTNGQAVSVNLAPYFSGDLTPFTFARTGAALTGTGLSITSAGLLTGTATTGSVTGVTITGTDSSSNTAVSNAFNVTVTSGDVTAPTFTVAPAVSGVTQTGGTATAQINETGSIFYVVVPQAQATPSVPQVIAGQNASGTAPIDSGSAVNTTTLSDAFTGLAAGTAYKACFVARDDEPTPNVQSSVTVVNFNAAAAPVGTITSQPLTRNSGTPSGVVSLSHIDARLQSTGSLVIRKTGVSTDGSSVFTFNDAAITTGSTYIVSWLESGGEFGIAYNVVAS